MNLGTAIGYLELNTDRWQRGFQTAQSQMRILADSSQSMGTRFSAAGKLMQGVGSTMSKYVTLPLVGVGAASVKTAADFEAGMSEVKAITGATGNDFIKLENQAKQLGANTKFSASEAAEGMKYFGMAGYKTNDIMSALPATLDLAAAGGTDLGLACDIVSDAMTGLGMSANQTGEFADKMAATITNSNTNIELMGETLKYVGPVAGTLGIEMGDLSVAIGLMSNSGIKGGQAGTALRAGLTNLVKPTDQMVKAMDKYNIELVKNDDGSVNLMGTMQNLRTQLGGLDQATQAQALATIFGKEAMSGWAAIVNASEGDFNKLTSAIENSKGKASEMAEIMQDNLKGQLTNLRSALEGAAISIGEAMLPMIKQLVTAIQNAVTWFNTLSPSIQRTIVVVAGIVASVGPLLIAFGSLFRAIGTLMPLFTGLRTAFLILKTLILDSLIPALGSLWAFMLANPITLVIAAIASLAAGFIYLWNNCDGFKEFWINLWDTVVEWCSNAVDSIVQFFSNLPSNLAVIWENVKTTISNACTSIGDFFKTTIPQWISNIGQWFNELPYNIGFALGTALGTVIKWGVDTWNYLATNVPLWIEGTVKFFSELPGRIWTWLVNAYQKTVQWGSQMLQKALETGSKFIQNIITFMQQLPGKVWSFLSQAISKAIQFVTQFAQKGMQAAQKFSTNIINGLKSLPGRVVSIGRNIVQGLWNGISGAAGWLYSKVASFATGILDGMKSALGIHSPSRVMRDIVGKNIVLGIGKGIEQEENTLLRTANAMTDRLTDAMVINPKLASEANSLNSSSNLATNSANAKRGIGNVVINLQNVNLSDKLDIESLASELAFYINRKTVF